jgi:hypothetical protein
MGLQLDIIPRWVVLDSGYAAGSWNGIPTRVLATTVTPEGWRKLTLGPEAGSYVAHDWEVADVGTPRADAAIAARRAA